MKPRLKSSTQWSPFPEELCQLTASVLTERFKEEYDLDSCEFVVEGRIFKEEILGRFGLQVKDQLKQHNFEISMDFDAEKEKALEKIQISLDVVEHLWIELLEDNLEDKELSEEWQPMALEKNNYFFRYTTVNSKLEQEADKLLAEYEKKLVYQNKDHDDSSLINTDEEPDSTIH